MFSSQVTKDFANGINQTSPQLLWEGAGANAAVSEVGMLAQEALSECPCYIMSGISY